MYVRPDQLQDIAIEITGRPRAGPYFPQAVLCDHELTTQYQRLHAAFDSASSQLARDVGLLSTLAMLVGRHARARSLRELPTGSRRAVLAARSYLEDNYAADVSLEFLAQLVALSPFHLARLFQQGVGMPPHAYQIQVRISRAKPMLLQGLP